MHDLSQNYDFYADILNDSIYTRIAILVLLTSAMVGVTLLIVWLIRGTKKNKDEKKENIGIVVCAVFAVFAIVGGTVICCQDISHALYDKEHRAYVVVEAPFRVKRQQYAVGKGMSGVCDLIIYEQDGEYVEVDVETFYCDLEQGRYTDAILVYGAQSKIVLDVIEIEPYPASS